MGDAAKKWMAAVEDPSKLIEENREWLRAARMLVSGDEAQEKEGGFIMDALRLGNHGICCPIPFTEVMEKKCAELHAAWLAAKAAAAKWKSRANKLQASVTGGLLSDQHRELRDDLKHATDQLANALIREQDLWTENQKLKDDISGYEIEMRARSDAAEKLACELNTERMQRKEFETLATSLEKELAAAPHWVPVEEFVDDMKPHIVWSKKEKACEAIYSARRSGWVICYTESSICDVTHVFVGLNPPVSNEDSRGDGNLPPENERLDNLTRECMRDAFDKMIETTRKMDEPPESAKPKRDLFVAESPNGPWHVWEQKTPGDYTLVAGPFHTSELAHATADKIRAEEDTSNDAGDASDVERAMRRRLMEPFLGSEAEKLGAKTYQLRDGELWEYLKRGVEWDFVDGLPCWFDDDTYRLAIGEQHAATD